jgi:hypothetical protein
VDGCKLWKDIQCQGPAKHLPLRKAPFEWRHQCHHSWEQENTGWSPTFRFLFRVWLLYTNNVYEQLACHSVGAGDRTSTVKQSFQFSFACTLFRN